MCWIIFIKLDNTKWNGYIIINVTTPLFVITDCQFTCHQKCGPLVRLGCKTPSTDEGIPPDPLSAETSLSEPYLVENTDAISEATNVRFFNGNQILKKIPSPHVLFL